MSRLLYGCMLLPIVIPPVVFAVCALQAGLAPDATWSALIEQYDTRKQNLLVVGLVGLFPVFLLLISLWIHRKVGGSEPVRTAMGWGGLLPILAILVWVNEMFWSIFLPGRTYPGFPHGLEFIIGPGVYAPIAMAVGMVIAWFIAKRSTTHE